MKAIASHNHRATQIHRKTQSTKTKLTTTHMNQLRPSPTHPALHPNPFAPSDGIPCHKLKTIRRRLIKMVGDIWRDQNGGLSDMGGHPELEQPLPHLPPHHTLPTPFSNQSARRWLDAILRHRQDTAWDRWRYRNGIQVGTQESTIFKEWQTQVSHHS